MKALLCAVFTTVAIVGAAVGLSVAEQYQPYAALAVLVLAVFGGAWWVFRSMFKEN